MTKEIVKTVLCIFTFVGVSAQAVENLTGTTTSTFPQPTRVNEEETYRPHVGLTAGVVDTAENFDNASEVGLDVGFQPYIPFGAGIEFGYSRSDKGSEELERTKVLARGTYNFGGDIAVIRHSYIGLGLGPVFDRYEGKNATNVGFMQTVGFDVPLKAQFERNSLSLGLNVSHLMVSSRPSATSAGAMLKYWY